MLKNHELKSLLVTALPLMAAFLAERGMEFIDTIMMGWIGPQALAAGALSTAVLGTLIICSIGILNVVGIFIAHAKGANNTNDIQATLHHGFCLALALAVPCMLILWWTPNILLAIGQDPLVIENVRLLLHGIVWGIPGFFFYFVLREFVVTLSSTLIVMVISFLSIPLTFLANYVLIYGKYNFPQLGVAGIGYGSATVMWFMFFCLMGYSKKKSNLKAYIHLNSFSISKNKLFDMLRVGIPSGLLYLLETGMFLATAVMMGYYGEVALAAHQIAMQCVNIAYTFPIALSLSASVKISHANGERNLKSIRSLILISISIALVMSLTIGILFSFASYFLVDLFLEKTATDFKTIENLATSFLKIAALFLCFDAMQSIANGSLRGIKDTFVPMLLSISCYWILGIGGAYYLSVHADLGAKGIWYGLTVGLGSTAILLMLRLYKKINLKASLKKSPT